MISIVRLRERNYLYEYLIGKFSLLKPIHNKFAYLQIAGLHNISAGHINIASKDSSYVILKGNQLRVTTVIYDMFLRSWGLANYLIK